MTRLYLILFFSLVSFVESFAQTNPTIINNDSIPLSEALSILEKDCFCQLFYRKEWVEKIKVPINKLDSVNGRKLLDSLISNTTLSYYSDGDDIILVNNLHIITSPSIVYSLYNEEQTGQEDEVFFIEEARNTNTNLENKLVAIGNRNKYVRNKRSTVAGYVTDIENGNPVEGVFIYSREPAISTSSDENGFYALTLPNGRQEILFQSVNMINTKRNLIIYSDGKLDISMEPDEIALNTVVINAGREQNVKSAQMGVTRISYENVKVVPALLGERDIVKVAASTAGVQNVGEGAAGINIRGGKADQNLFLLDGAPLFNTNHFFGFFSVFNADVISDMKLYKSAIPAEFGGRLSSVFDIRSKSPKKEKISAAGGVGPVTSRLMVEGPTFSGGPSFMLGGRATYSDFVLRGIKNSSLKNNKASFYDVMGKLEHKFNDKNTIKLTGYISKDHFQLASDTLLSYTNFKYTNKIVVLNWQHIINDRLQGKLELGTSSYEYGLGYDILPAQAFDINFFIKEHKLAEKFDYYVNEKINFNFGVEAKFNVVSPGKRNPIGDESLVELQEIPEEKGGELAPYFSAIYNMSDRLSVNGGVRFSIYNVIGPATVFEYEEGSPKSVENIVNINSYENNQVIKTYFGPEVRLSSRFSLNDNSSIKAGYNRTRQNTHLLINSASIAPNDIWRLSSAHLKPQIADQFSVGYYKNFYEKHTIETSVEAYYKQIQNLLDIKVGSDLQFNPYIETEVLQGVGRSYGIEFSVKKSEGWLTGWINYTFSRSLIKIDGDFPEETINSGRYFPTGYDKPHYINSVTNYKFTRRFTMTLNLVYSTGIPITYPVGKWYFKTSENLFYSDRNAFRIPDYFRMDIGFNIDASHKLKKMVHSSWTFSIYNLLGRDNIYSIFFKVEDGVVNGYKLSVFSNPIPTITYNFIF